MKRILNAILFAILFIWQIPQNIVALCILIFSKNTRFLAYRHYCIALSTELPKKAGGISLGNFALIAPNCAQIDEIVRHEVDGHTVDSKILGPLYLFIIGIPSLLHLIFLKPHKDYGDFYTERWANRHAGLTNK